MSIFQWKMRFIPDSCKEAKEVIFTWKINRKNYSLLTFQWHKRATKRFLKKLWHSLKLSIKF